MSFVLGVLVLGLLVWGLYGFRKFDAARLAKSLRPLGGAALVAVAGVLAVRGHFESSIPLGLFGLGLLGWGPIAKGGWLGGGSARGTSRLRAPTLEIEIDQASGMVRGRVLAGRHAGVELDRLDRAALMQVYAEADSESRTLLGAYLDRRTPGWRANAQHDANAGRSAARGKMTEQEAYQILGLQPGAAADDIRRSHRSLMKKLHPDQGGSTYLAAQINEAKEMLLRRHR